MYTVTITLGVITFNGILYSIPFNIQVYEGELGIYNTMVSIDRAPDNLGLVSIKQEVKSEFTTAWENFLNTNIDNLMSTLESKLYILEEELESVVN